jgi:hypothetical protein
MNFAALSLVILAVPLQLLGLTSTCTQGANGTFISGSLLSGPLLIVATIMVAWKTWSPSLDTPGRARLVLSLLVLAPIAMMAGTWWAWWNVLADGHPCGADYVSWDSGIEVDDVLVLIAYAVLPPAIASLAVVQLAQSIMNERARRFREKKRR